MSRPGHARASLGGQGSVPGPPWEQSGAGTRGCKPEAPAACAGPALSCRPVFLPPGSRPHRFVPDERAPWTTGLPLALFSHAEGCWCHPVTLCSVTEALPGRTRRGALPRPDKMPSPPSKSSCCVRARPAGPGALPKTRTLSHRTHFPQGPLPRPSGSPVSLAMKYRKAEHHASLVN